MKQQSTPLPIAIAGAGAITNNAHLPAALRSPFVELVALVDKNLSNAKALVHRYSLNCLVADDLKQVIDKVRAVVIATPPESHFALAEFALNHGVSVLVEKPMTVSYSDALKLCDLAESRKSVLAVGYYQRCFPNTVLMKQLLEKNFFGNILGFELQFGSTGGWSPVSGYNLDRKQSGGGELIANGTHFVDLLLYWFDEPASSAYEDDSHGGPEANCKALLQYANQLGRFTGRMIISKTIQLKNSFIMDTEKYICERLQSQTQSLTLYPKSHPGLRLEVYPNEVLPPLANPYQVQLERFVGNVQGWASVSVDGRFAARSVKLIEEMYNHRSQLSEPWLLYRTEKEKSFVAR